MCETEESCVKEVLNSIIFLDSMWFIVCGLYGLFLNGCWLAENANMQVLFKVHGNQTLSRHFMERIGIQPLYHCLESGFKAYLGIAMCLASCFSVGLRVLCALFLVLTFSSGGVLLWDVTDMHHLKELGSDLRQVFLSNLQSFYNDTRVDDTTVARFTFEMDLAQVYLNCCGVEGWGDYDTSTLWKMQGGGRQMSVPLTCCLMHDDAFLFLNEILLKNASCRHHPTPANSRVERGCGGQVLQMLASRLTTNAVIMDAVSVGVYALTTFLLVFLIRLPAKNHLPPDQRSRFLAGALQVALRLSDPELKFYHQQEM